LDGSQLGSFSKTLKTGAADRWSCFCTGKLEDGASRDSCRLAAYRAGHDVTLLASQPDVVRDMDPPLPLGPERWRPYRFTTFDDLQRLLANEVTQGGYDAIIHSAAVSDYLSAGIFAPAQGTQFNEQTGRWTGPEPALVDRAAAKVKSDEAELWLRLVPAPKLIDMVTTTGFPLKISSQPCYPVSGF
jgi:phosphopantothenate---cysteine ligase (CTP)